MTETAVWKRPFQIEADWRAVSLIGLFLVVISGALLVRPEFIAQGTHSIASGSTTSEQAAGGAAWALGEAIFAGLLLGAILLWQRLPEVLRSAIQSGIKFGIPMYIGALAFKLGGFRTKLLLAIVLVVGLKLVTEYDFWWVVNDLLALGFAIYLGAMTGVVLGPVILGVGLIGLSIYDYIFADRESWMFTLGSWTIRRRLPLVFVVPKTPHLEWDVLAETMAGEDTGLEIGFGIGMADLLLPAAFAVALANTGAGLPLYGAIAGTLAACFRVSAKMGEGGGAGMPPLTTGALTGWAVAAVALAVISA